MAHIKPQPRANGEKQRRLILDTIGVLTTRYRRPPTVREVAETLGITNTGHISYHIDRLRQTGKLLPGDGRSRGLIPTSTAD